MASATKYGIIMGAFLIGLGVLFHLVDGEPTDALGTLFYLIGPAVLYWFLNAYPGERLGQFWDMFKTTLVVSAVGTGIYGIFVLVLNGAIDGSYLEKVRTLAESQLEGRSLEGQALADAQTMIAVFTNAPMFALTVALQIWASNAISALPLISFVNWRRNRHSKGV